MNLNLKQSNIYLALKWNFVFRLIRPFKILFFVLFILVSTAAFFALWSEDISQDTARRLLGASIIFLVFLLSALIGESFFADKIKRPLAPVSLSKLLENINHYNLADFLSFETALAVKKIKPGFYTSPHFFYNIISDNPKLNFVFLRALLSLGAIKKELKRYLNERRPLPPEKKYSSEFEQAILLALETARRKKHQKIEIGDILSALAKIDPIFSKILNNNKLKFEDIENLVYWLEALEARKEKRREFWEYENLAKYGTLAKQWSASYTIHLDEFGRDITDMVKGRIKEFAGHKKEIEMLERILSRREINNALIIGKPGTGRLSIIYALARKSLLGKSASGLNYKRVVELDLSALLAKVEGIDEAEEVLDNIFKESAKAGNIILVINKLHNYIGQDQKPGIIDIAGVLAPYLKFPQFQLIGITTYSGLHRYIERNPSILSFFEKIEVSEISKKETLMLLRDLALVLERKHKKFISYPALESVISLTERYMPSLAFPEKALEILDEVVIYTATSTNEKIVLPKHVSKIVTEKTEIPVGEIETKEKEVLLNLEELIHRRIINQDEAVREISTALRRARSEITVRKGPMGAFLFLGPTGVGKTETSKALAQVYFKSEKRMVRMDMSEFQNPSDIYRLIGSQNEKGLLTTAVRENPFSLVLLDEFEKAHPNILNLFLQVLDEGYLTDGLGRKVDFKNTIIICTSNAGYQIILQVLREMTESGPLPPPEKQFAGKGKDAWTTVKKRLLDYLFSNRIFRPELINRFDGFIVFRPLSKQNLFDISRLLLSKLKKNLKEKGIEFIIREDLKQRIVELGYEPKFGAREMRRVIQEKVENVFAQALLKDQLKRGQKVEMDKDFRIIIR